MPYLRSPGQLRDRGAVAGRAQAGGGTVRSAGLGGSGGDGTPRSKWRPGPRGPLALPLSRPICSPSKQVGAGQRLPTGQEED